MLTLFKALVMSRLDYGCQLWSPYLIKHINMVEKVQRSFTGFIYISIFRRILLGYYAEGMHADC